MKVYRGTSLIRNQPSSSSSELGSCEEEEDVEEEEGVFDRVASAGSTRIPHPKIDNHQP